MSDHHAFDPDLAIGLAYFDFDHGGDIGLGAIILNERDTAAAMCPGSWSSFLRRWTSYPAGSFCCSLEDGLSARIAQVSQAKLQRVHARRAGKLIHERFVGERVLRRAETSQRGSSDRA